MTRAAQTLVTPSMMHALIALALALCAPALGVPAPRDRIGYEREIDSSRYNEVPKIQDYVLNGEYLASQKNRAKLVTKLHPEEALAADNVIVESNFLEIVKPSRRRTAVQVADEGLVRKRRGYNLENVRVPARYPYLPVARFNRFRRWGY